MPSATAVPPQNTILGDCTFRHQASVSEGRVAPSYTLRLMKGQQHLKAAKAFVDQIVHVPRAGDHRLHGSGGWASAGAAGDESSRLSPSKDTSYLPSISDLVIATIQPRHIGLWIAVQNNNWPFAAYELGNLKGAFDRLGRAHPTDHEIPLQHMISSVTAQL
jgi:hypothetical protein